MESSSAMSSTEFTTISEALSEFERAFRPLHDNYWFALRAAVLIAIRFFRCEMCGNCCRFSPLVFSEDEAWRIAEFLGKRVEELPLRRVEYCVCGRVIIYYKAPRPCPFLSGNRCAVYEVRGSQCRAFPFEFLMYSLVPAYCPAIPKALRKAAEFISQNFDVLRRAVRVMEDDLKRLATDFDFKEAMRRCAYEPLVRKLFTIISRLREKTQACATPTGQ